MGRVYHFATDFPQHALFHVTACLQKRGDGLIRNGVARDFCDVLHEKEVSKASVVIAFVVMPDHIHIVLMLQEKCPLHVFMKQVKGASARQVNAKAARSGTFWQENYWDYAIDSSRMLEEKMNYVHTNPVRAGFVDEPEGWPYSSARYYREQYGQVIMPAAQGKEMDLSDVVEEVRETSCVRWVLDHWMEHPARRE